MKRPEDHRESPHKESNESIDSSFGSILFSVFLVVLAMGFVFGFKYFLSGDLFHAFSKGSMSAEDTTSDQTRMEQDHNFKYEYVMVGDLTGKDLFASEIPDVKDASARELAEGQILGVNMRGYIDEKLYYQLDNGLYLKADKSIIPLKEFIKLSGYVTITYISSSGVRLRKWADFDADNSVGSVYVGDKVTIKGKVVTISDVEAFITTDGYYMTTNSRYLNDHTNVVQGSRVAIDPDQEEASSEGQEETDTETDTEVQEENGTSTEKDSDKKQ